MLGIPTRSDVTDKKYRASVVAEELRRSLGGFNWPTSSCFIHNHLVGSKKGDLDPTFVLEHYVAGINYFRQNLERAISLGLASSETSTTCSSHPNEVPYFEGSSMKSKVRKRKRGIEERLVVVTPVKKPFKHDERDGFKIKFDATELVLYELGEYEGALKRAFELSSNPRTQIKRMRRVMDEFDDSAHKDLISHSLMDPFKPEWSSSIEDRKGTEAHRLKQQYQEVVDRSNIYLRFDEFYVVMKRQNGETCIPAQVLLDQTNPLTSGGLWHRQGVRDEISSLLDSKGRFVFNGVIYDPEISVGEGLVSYTTSGGALKELVNVLGVHAINGQVITPDEWATEEVDLVRRHRGGDVDATESFLKKYSDWGSSEHRNSRRDELDHVEYVLKGRTTPE